jgi:hypothetical protein
VAPVQRAAPRQAGRPKCRNLCTTVSAGRTTCRCDSLATPEGDRTGDTRIDKDLPLLDPFGGPDGRRRERTFRALEPLGDVAGLFRDACLVLTNDAAFRGSAPLVLHALGEVLSALRGVLDPGSEQPAETRREVTTDVRAALEQVLMDAGLNHDEATLDKIVEVAGPRDDESRQIDRVCEALGVDSHVAERWRGLRLHSRAHRRSLSLTHADAAYRAVVSDAMFVLDSLADTWNRRWPQLQTLVEQALSADPPTRELASALVQRLPSSPQIQEAFFSAATDGRCVAPLARAGMVARPPNARRSERSALLTP